MDNEMNDYPPIYVGYFIDEDISHTAIEWIVIDPWGGIDI